MVFKGNWIFFLLLIWENLVCLSFFISFKSVDQVICLMLFIGILLLFSLLIQFSLDFLIDWNSLFWLTLDFISFWSKHLVNNLFDFLIGQLNCLVFILDVFFPNFRAWFHSLFKYFKLFLLSFDLFSLCNLFYLRSIEYTDNLTLLWDLDIISFFFCVE